MQMRHNGVLWTIGSVAARMEIVLVMKNLVAPSDNRHALVHASIIMLAFSGCGEAGVSPSTSPDLSGVDAIAGMGELKWHDLPGAHPAVFRDLEPLELGARDQVLVPDDPAIEIDGVFYSESEYFFSVEDGFRAGFASGAPAEVCSRLLLEYTAKYGNPTNSWPTKYHDVNAVWNGDRIALVLGVGKDGCATGVHLLDE